ncbi:hypothetical protein MRS44_001417 [Fusarium solani]|uniref:uncharacterized protein n=1 Tax=Fusarium solani TaxID=169388 RepID=UPI0032C3F413|nr:hypothetical protein MRS44_001417 [Fusarium solani]
MEIMLRAMKRENDEAERKLRDEIDKEKKRQSELSSSNLQDREDCIASLLQLFRADQEMGEISARTPTTHGNRTPPSRCKYQGHPDKLDLILTNTQEELEKLRHRYRGVVTQTDTKSETAFTSS